MPSTVSAKQTAAPDDAAVASTTYSECKGLHCSNMTLPEPESDSEEEYALVRPEDE